MKILFLDLASHDALIACCDDQNTVGSESVHARIGDHEVIPMIEKVLAEAGWSFEGLEAIACIVGPGGFTSLRVAVTFANVLSDQLGIGSVGIHLSDLYRARVGSAKDEVRSAKGKEKNVYWLHSTKKDQLFVCGGEWKEPTLISIDELQSRITNHESRMWMGELIDEHQSIIQADPINLLPISDVLPELLSTQKYDEELLVPWYGRGW